MKKTHRRIALLLSLLMLVAPLATACDNGGNENASETETLTDNTGGNQSTDGKVNYTFSVNTIGGRALSNLPFYVYSGEEMAGYGTTDENGIGSVQLDPAKSNYELELASANLTGYDLQSRYPLTANGTSIVLTSSIISDSDLAGVSYKLGDVMRDFTVTTTDGTTLSLSQAMDGKKGVLINFFYTTCGPCVNEFPFMEEAYQQFKNDIEIIAINNYAGDDENGVKLFKETMALSFPMAKDYSALGSAFNVDGYPTSIFIDRYGVICLIEVGGLTSKKPFVAAFEHFAASNYRQILIDSIDELTPVEKPNISMPSSEEIGAAANSEGFTATYYPETGTNDAEYAWPFLVGERDGRSVVYPSNRFKDSSYAIMHMDVTLKAGEALAVDYFSSCEERTDILYVLVDDKDIYQISGESTEWEVCYPYVATDDGTYKVTFIYNKDSGDDVGEDTCYLDNFRIVSKDEVNTPTYIYRFATSLTNDDIVYNENDGYYHVGHIDGPLLMVNLMNGTPFHNTSLNDLGYEGRLKDGDVDYYETIRKYANYSINGAMYGYTPVTDEMRDVLVKISDLVGWEKENPNQWLQMCAYYDHYGTDQPLEDPIKGIAFFAAFDTVESTDTEEIFNTVTYDGRVIMPRGLKYRFTPTRSGAYLIKSQSDSEVNGWIFDEQENIILTASIVDRFVTDTDNVSMLLYMEAGKTYYIDIAYYDVYAAGTFTFTLKYVGETYDQLHIAAPAPFTSVETAGGGIGEILADGIKVALGEDGYYHELRKDGSLGSIVYADFSRSTGLFSHSLLEMIELGGFNFAYSEYDQEVMSKLKELNNDKDAVRNHYKTVWGADYDAYAEEYKLEEILDDIFHGKGEDLTPAIRVFIDKMISEDDPELGGCVPVDAELADLLQKLMDKYTFVGVTNSWTKLCYYYKHHGPTIG